MRVSRTLFLLLFFSFFFQQFWLSGLSSPIKPYMIASILGLIYVMMLFPLTIKIHTPLYTPMVVFFFIYMSVTILWAENQDIAYIRIVGIAMLILTYTMLSVLYSRISHKSLEKVIFRFSYLYLFSSLIYYFIGIYLIYFYGVELGDERKLLGLYLEGKLPRMRAFTDSPNNFILVLLCIFYFNLILREKVPKIFYGMLIVCLLCTFSVTGYISFIIPLIAIIIFQPLKVKAIVIIIFSGVFLTLYFLYIENNSFAAMVDTRLFRISTGSGRFDLFEYILLSIKSPFIGEGISQTKVLLESYGSAGLQSTHNSFLEILYEGGILGLTLFIFCWLFFMIYVSSLNNITKENKIYLLSYLLSLLVISSANMMVYVELMIFNLFCLWMISNRLKYLTNVKLLSHS